jgi:hypothetical protein
MQSKSFLFMASLGLSTFLYGSLAAAQAPSLGSAQGFAVLGGSTVTNTGASAITGDLGVSPGTAITGFPPGTFTGTLHAGDAVALQAQSDVTTAYDALAGAVCTSVLTGMDLGGLTLTPGVYCFAASAPLNGALTLDGLGDPNAVFIFQIGSTLLAAIDSSVVVVNGARASNVFWQVGSSATLAAGTAFSGNIIALASITLSSGASVSGRALARTAAVTMDTSSVSVPSSGGCGASASVVEIAPACGPMAPLITCTLPVIGQSATITLSGSLPLSNAFVLATPMGIAPRDFHGCPLYYDSASSRFVADFVTSGSGDDVHMRMPSNAALCGTQWSLQAVVFPIRSVASVSNTLLCTIGS